MKIVRIAFLLLLWTSDSAIHAQNDFIFGKNISPASRLDTLLKITDTKNETTLPLSVIKGRNEGPVFTIVGGIHGYEYPPIIALQEILAELNPDELNGTLVIIPIANTPAFYGRTVFLNPQDAKNLNRVFPGDKNGTITEQIANYISEKVITGSDVFLDIHGGDASEDLLPFVCYYDKKDAPEQNQLARTLTQAAGFTYNVVYPYNIGPEEPAQYAFKHATQQEVTALSIEAGKLGTVQEDAVQLIKTGVYNMLDEMKMYGHPGDHKPKKQVWITGQDYIKSPAKGIFYSDLRSGDRISGGQLLGYITDEFGNKLTEITSPENGIILYKIGTPPVNTGETLFCIGSM
ncbi:succinylglutamate desuccinylase/aspartoacylase family protein [Sinomicrobium sp. M5D2P17]